MTFPRFLWAHCPLSRNDWKPYVLLHGDTRSSEDEPRFNWMPIRLCIHFLLEYQYNEDRLGILQSKLFWNRQLLMEVSTVACLYDNGYQCVCSASSGLNFHSKMIACKLQSALAVKAHLMSSLGINAPSGDWPLPSLPNLHHCWLNAQSRTEGVLNARANQILRVLPKCLSRACKIYAIIQSL